MRDLESLPPYDNYQTEPYFTLWSALCHQDTVYTASYAAVPHIVRIFRSDPGRAPWTLLSMVASIEIARSRGRGPAIPKDLAPAYQEALGEIPQLVAGAARAGWDHWYCMAALAAVAAAKGFPILAEAILELDPESATDFIKRKLDE